MKLSALSFLVFVMVLSAFSAISDGQPAGPPPIYEVKFEKVVYVNKGTVQPTPPCPANGPADDFPIYVFTNTSCPHYTLRVTKLNCDDRVGFCV